MKKWSYAPMRASTTATVPIANPICSHIVTPNVSPMPKQMAATMPNPQPTPTVLRHPACFAVPVVRAGSVMSELYSRRFGAHQ